MPTASNDNGPGPSAPGPTSRASNGTADPHPVRKGGPFDLAEIERLANEMFRAVPGAVLPGIDPERFDPVVPTPEQVAHLASPVEPEPPVPEPPAGLFTLSGESLPLYELGVAGRPRGETEDPFLARHYFLGGSNRPPVPALPATPTDRRSSAPTVNPAPAHPGFDVDRVRSQFPILAERMHGHPLVWLDNGATTQKPQAVIDRLSEFYRHENSNIHRGAHELATRATDAYEHARGVAGRFLHAGSSDEIVFLRGTTEAINLVAQSWGRAHVGPGDEIMITWLEHHANIVPWQQLCQATGARLCVVPVDDHGQVQLDEVERRLSDRTRLVAVSHVSNALGTITPVREITELAHRYGARVLIDGAQAVSHLPVDVQLLDSDWYAFSGHKVFGPTGIGVLHGKRELLDAMPPWQGGGNMIRDVTFEHTVYQAAPARFEAGTASIADAVGLAAALDYVERIGRENIARHEHELLEYATEALLGIPGLALIGTAPEKASILSFVLPGLPPEEVGADLDREGIAVRAGHHCAQPIVRRFGREGTVRASLALYNTCADVDALIDALHRIATRSVTHLDGR
jgi:cysteine desulfurase / selenocysteine lyase